MFLFFFYSLICYLILLCDWGLSVFFSDLFFFEVIDVRNLRLAQAGADIELKKKQIGRASCRERVEKKEGAGGLKKKKKKKRRRHKKKKKKKSGRVVRRTG